MILVIEDDFGAAWTVCEDVESVDMQSTEGRESIANMVAETIEEINSENYEYQQDCAGDKQVDLLDDDGIEVPEGGEIGLEESDDLSDEVDL